MTSRPSYIAHSGFVDLINLVASTPSRFFSSASPRNPSPDRPGIITNPDAAHSGVPYAEHHAPALGNAAGGYTEEELDPERARGAPAAKGGGTRGGLPRGGRVGATGGRQEWQAGELRKRKVDKRMIGPPTEFRHVFHASTYEEATELLLRWSAEGVGFKVGDPSWAYPIKELVKFRAREQQARAIAAVVDAHAQTRGMGDAELRDLPPPGTLRVVNGMPSSIYSTQNTTPLMLTSVQGGGGNGRNSGTSISPSLAHGDTPRIIVNFTGYFEPNDSSSLLTPVTPRGISGNLPPESPKDSPTSQRARRGSHPLQIRKKSTPPLPITAEDAEVLELIAGLPHPHDPASKHLPPTPLTPSKRKDPRPAAQDIFTPLPFRIIKPSLPTLERAMSVALFFEQYYHALLKPSPGMRGRAPSPSKPVHPGNYVLSRARRAAQLESTFGLPENRFMSEGEKEARREELAREENRLLRERRKKVDVKGFELGRVIGHGAFGVVRIARERESGRLVAMKQLRKADMLRKSQEGHVRAEKDLLAAAASQSLSPLGAPSRIVQLHYAFQDVDHLYLVLEFMGGGDLLNLLVERDTFPEEMTRFYVAEMVLALEETHALGYVHRDIKPDNFLFDRAGHIKVSDFGLATDLHWAHDTSYYDQQRLALLRKHGVDLEYPSVKTKRMNKEDVERIMGKEWMEEGKGVLSWRDKNRKQLAYSVCGTNSYMAPEVIRGQGYGFSCDWWSLGIIMYESLYGYPPFVSASRHITRQKILNWRQTLKFPPKPRLSQACTSLLTTLLCEPEDRLGSTPLEKASVLTTSKGSTIKGVMGFGSDGAEQIKAHEWFSGLDWDNLHKQTSPYHPDLYSDDDTRHFDDDIPGEPLAPANGAAPDATKDPLLRNKTHGAHLLEIRKSLAFQGWTFKSPQLETRYGHLDHLSSGQVSHMRDISEETVNGRETQGGQMLGLRNDAGRGTARARALSL
ncbi:hypothetical protein IAT38_008172 [Cryptococcus sp. DSM 104549]